MTLDLGRLITRAFSLCWRNRWIAVLGAPSGGGGTGVLLAEASVELSVLVGVAVGAALTGVGLGQVIAVVVAAAVGLGLIAAIIYVAAAAQAAVIWTGLELDSGAVGMRRGWREGRNRARRFIAILGIQLLVYIVPFAAVFAVFLGFATTFHGASGGTGAPTSSGAGVLGLFLVVGASELAALAFILVCQVLFSWAPAIAVIRDIGAVASFAASWRLFFRHKLDLFIVFIVGVLGMQLASVTVFAGALVCTTPGALLVLGGLAVHQVWLTAIGIVVGGVGFLAVFVLGGGFLGSIQQVMYALACRDLAIQDGVIAAPDLGATLLVPVGASGPVPA